MENDGSTQVGEQHQEERQLGVKETIAALRAGVESGELPREVGQRNAIDGGVRSTEAPAATDAESDPLVVDVPGTSPDEAPLRIQLDSPEDAARVRNALAGAESADEVAQMRQEYEMFEDLLATDPSFIAFSELPLQGKVDLAQLLMADEAVAEAVHSDPRDAAQIKLDALARRDVLHAQFASKQSARAINEAMERLVPNHLDDAHAAAFLKHARNDVVEHIRRTGATSLHPTELLDILADTFDLWNINPAEARARLARAGHVPIRRRSPNNGTQDRALENAKKTGPQFAADRARRRALTAMPGAGAGAQPTKLQPPPKQGVKDRIAWLRAKFGRGS